MEAFLLITLTPERTFTFGPPILQAVKQKAPGLDLFDVDAFSDPSLVSYAARLIREATKLVVFFQVEGVGPGFGSCLPLVEELMRRKESALVMVQGQHRRLKAILEDLPPLEWQEVSSEEDILRHLEIYLNQPPTGK